MQPDSYAADLRRVEAAGGFYARRCPTCGWLISETQYYAIRYDVGCPECRTLFAAFRRVVVRKAGEGER
jgi:phage FluMu protein Com